jgi:hypothetical protein
MCWLYKKQGNPLHACHGLPCTNISKDCKTVKLFSGQGVEKNNDVARSIVLRKSNNWDAAADVLKLESRQWDLRKQERAKRMYTKKKYRVLGTPASRGKKEEKDIYMT